MPIIFFTCAGPINSPRSTRQISRCPRSSSTRPTIWSSKNRSCKRRYKGSRPPAHQSKARPWWCRTAISTPSPKSPSGPVRSPHSSPNSRRGGSAPPALFGFDIGVVNDLAVLVHFAGDVFGEIIRRRADRLEAEHCQARLDLGLGQNLGDAGLQFCGEVRGQILRTPEPVPRHELETRQTGFLY